MKHLKTYESFEHVSTNLNEGLFDKIGAFFNKVMGFFKDPAKVNASVDKAFEDLGDKTKKWTPKESKKDETVYIKLGAKDSAEGGFVVAMTKVAEFSDGGGLFQITGSTSEEMLKALVGTTDVADLTEKSVMAMVPAIGMEVDKPMQLVILKNIIPDGKPYTSESMVKGIASGIAVEKAMTTVKTA